MSDTQTFNTGDAVLVNYDGKPAGARVEGVEKSGKVDARITDYGHAKHGYIVKFAPEDVQPMPADYVPPEIPKPKTVSSPMAGGGRGPNSVPAKRVAYEELGDDPDSISYAKTDDGTWWVYLPGVGKGRCSNHAAEENADGTLTLSPSLKMDAGPYGYRHGYLTNGIWNPCADDRPPAPKPAEPPASQMPAADSEDFKAAVLDLHAKLPGYAEDVKNFVKAHFEPHFQALKERLAAAELQVESHGKELGEANARIAKLEAQPSNGPIAVQEEPKKKDEGDAEQIS